MDAAVPYKLYTLTIVSLGAFFRFFFFFDSSMTAGQLSSLPFLCLKILGGLMARGYFLSCLYLGTIPQRIPKHAAF